MPSPLWGFALTVFRDFRLFYYLLSLGLFLLPLVVSQQFLDRYTVVKWEGLYLFTLVTLAYFVKYQKILIPKLGFLSLCFGALLLLIFANMIVVHKTPIISTPTLDRLTFWILVLFFAIAFDQKHLSFHFLIGPIILSTIVFLSVVFYRLGTSHFNLSGPDLAFTFGNVNMSAQFIGASIVVQLYALQSLKSKNWVAGGLFVLLVLSVIYLAFTNCRSVFVGLAFALSAILFLRFRHRLFQKHLFKRLLIMLGSFMVFGFLIGYAYIDNSQLFAGSGKMQSALHRVELWQQTLSLIRDHPLGVGPDRFEFAFIPYKIGSPSFPPRESIIEKSPHNEILRFMAEDGLIIVGLFVLFLSFILIKYPKAFESILSDKQGRYAFSLFLFLGVESFFQFPLDTPYPFFLIAFLTGFLAWKFLKQIGMAQTISLAPLSVIGVFCIYLSIFSCVLYAKYSEYNYTFDGPKSDFACKLCPLNWRVCLNKAYADISQNNFDAALKSLDEELEKNPHNFVAMRYLGLALLGKGEKLEGCRVLRQYNDLFNGQCMIKGILNETCDP